MLYWVAAAVLASWVIYDCLQRKTGYVVWGVFTFVLAPIALPLHFAMRPLKEGEVREGGKAWNVLKNFSMVWTVLMAVVAFQGCIAASEVVVASEDPFGAAGATIGTAIGLGMLGALWFFPLVGALMIGLFLKKSSVVERGPTGKLAQVTLPQGF